MVEGEKRLFFGINSIDRGALVCYNKRRMAKKGNF